MAHILLRTPASLLVLIFALVLIALTAVPVLGFAFMLLAAFLWTGPLINFAMIGLFIEPTARQFLPVEARISFFWMLFPILYAGWFGLTYHSDNGSLEDIQAEFDEINAAASIPYDPSQHSLVFESGTEHLAKELITGFGIPKIYLSSEQSGSDYFSSSLIDAAVCDEFRANKALRAASISISSFHEGKNVDPLRPYGTLVTDFCVASMPDVPQGAKVLVSIARNKSEVYGLRGQFTKTTVTMPDGVQYTLRGGTVQLLRSPPRPALGCGFNSNGSNVRCGGGFIRDRTASVTSSTRSNGETLAKALGLEPVAPSRRSAPNSALASQIFKATLDEALKQDLAYYRALVADPSIKPEIGSTGAIEDRPDLLVPLAPQIVEGILAASRPNPDDINHMRDEGVRLARAFGQLPSDEQNKYASDFADLYLRLDKAGDGRHWLYEIGNLMRYRKALEVGYPPPSLMAE